MSTPPKDPKPEEPSGARRGASPGLEQTFLGVAPALPAAASSGAPAGSSAIVAAPMISVSGEQAPRQPSVAVSPPVGPARPPALQGGWQSAGVPRPPALEQTALQGTPSAWAAPPGSIVASPAAPPRVLAPPRPEHTPPARQAAASTPVGASGSLHHTALTSDYLRGARDAALAGAAAAPPTPPPVSVPPHAYPTAPVFSPEPELLHGPRSMGTQASVAPPPTEGGIPPASSASPLYAPALMSSAPNPVRGAAPQPLGGTMLDRTPNIPGGTLPHAASAAPSAANSVTGGFSARFEQVPSARGPLAQHATGFGLQIPIDQSASDWGRPSLEQRGRDAPEAKPSSQLRVILLTALAVLAIGFVAFGRQLLNAATRWSSQRSETAGVEPAAVGHTTRTPDQATLTNLPSQPAAPLPAAEAAGTSGAASAAASAGSAERVASASAETAAAAGNAAGAAATAESRLAAQAARHVLAAHYAEALPLYRELQRSHPQNTAYSAMTRVLEQKTIPHGKPAAAQP